MTTKQRDLICSVLFLAFGVFFYVQATGIKAIMDKDLGSGFVPKLIALAIIAIAVLKLVLTLTSKATAEKVASFGDIQGGLFSILALVVYVLLFDKLGFIVSTAIYLFAQVLILTTKENRSYKVAAIIAIAVPLCIYVLFVYLIKMPLPAGILSF